MNFGKYTSNLKKSAIFKIENKGDMLLKIIRIQKTCDCTAIKLPSTDILPGKFVILETEITPYSVKGKYSKKVFLETNDPNNRFTTIRLKGEAIPLVNIIPTDRIYAERLIIGQEHLFIYKLSKSDKLLDIKTKSIKSNYPLTVKIDKINETTSNVFATVKPKGNKGRLHAEITLSISDNKNDDIKLYLSADIEGAIYAIPSRLQIPINSKQMSIKLKIAGIDPAKIDTKLLNWSKPDDVEITVQNLEYDTINVLLTFNKKLKHKNKQYSNTIKFHYPGAIEAKCRF